MFVSPSKGNRIIYLMDKICKNRGGKFYCDKITDGFYRGSQPAQNNIVEIVKKYGIKTIVNLKTISNKELSEMTNFTKKLGIQYINIPLDPFYVDKSLLPLYGALERASKENPVFIHCVYGKDRTGFVSALIKHFKDNASSSDVINDMYSYGYNKLLFSPMLVKLKSLIS